MEGRFGVFTGHSLRWATAEDRGVTLGLVTADGRHREMAADHVIAATGYRSDLSRLAFLDPAVTARLRTIAGTPAVGKDYQSSVPGLYFMGPGVAPTFGPVMRFVYGTDHAARTAARRLTAAAGQRTAMTVGAPQ